MKETKQPDWLIDAAPRIISHMNEDHSNSIVSTLHAQHQIKDPKAKMEALKTSGYFVQSKGERFFCFWQNMHECFRIQRRINKTRKRLPSLRIAWVNLVVFTVSA